MTPPMPTCLRRTLNRARALALVSVLGAAAALPACTDKVDPAAAARSPTAPAGIPRINFDAIAHDFGSIVDTQEYRTTFRFTNTGTGKLVISDVKAGCGCTVPTLRKSEVLPGESSTIDVVFTPSGKVGLQQKTISVISNARPGNVTTLTIQGHIRPLVRIDTLFLEFGEQQLGQQHTRRVSVSYADPDLAISDVAVTNPYISAQARSGSSGITLVTSTRMVSPSRERLWLPKE